MQLKPKCRVLSFYYGLEIKQVFFFVFDIEPVMVAALQLVQRTVKHFDVIPKQGCKVADRTQCVQILLGLCSLKIQHVNYFQNFALFIQNSLLLNQYIAGIDLKVFENSHCTHFVESHLKLRYIPFWMSWMVS
jgi:hypothetical protein